jgi:hypothetical protein
LIWPGEDAAEREYIVSEAHRLIRQPVAPPYSSDAMQAAIIDADRRLAIATHYKVHLQAQESLPLDQVALY